jgi:putative transposase
MVNAEVIIEQVRPIRKKQPRVGTRKLQKMLAHRNFEVGRDRLFSILREHQLLVKPARAYHKTTNSHHRFRRYSNLIKDVDLSRINQVFVADITYIRTLEGFCYLSLLTDLYSRKIVGWNLSRSMGVEDCAKALRMALADVPHPGSLIHHSDRGIQYCCPGYVKILERRNARISMTEEDHVYENAVAERVNGILKTEFLLGEQLKTFEVANKLAKEAIAIYNEERLHASLNYRTPAAVHAA